MQRCVNFRPVLQGRGGCCRSGRRKKCVRLGSAQHFSAEQSQFLVNRLFSWCPAPFSAGQMDLSEVFGRSRDGGRSLGREILLSMILRAVRQNAVWRVRRTLPTRCDDSTAVTAIRWIDWRWAFVFSGARRYRDASPWLRRNGLRPSLNIRRASVSQVLVTLTIWTLPLVGGHHDVDLLLRVPVLRLRIDRTPPLRSVPKPFGSQFSAAGEGIVVSKLSPPRRADGEVLRRIFEPVISTD